MAAHEFFHAIQFYYDCGEERWWMEATAVWMQDEVYNHNFYIGFLNHGPPPDYDPNGGWLDNPDTPLTTFDGWHEYGSVIFAKFLSERKGIGIIKDIWEEMVNSDGLTAIDNVLKNKYGTNLKTVFSDFTVTNYLNGNNNHDGDFTNDQYEDGDLYDDVGLTADKTFLGKTINIQDTVNEYAADYIYIRRNGYRGPLKIKFDGNWLTAFNVKVLTLPDGKVEDISLNLLKDGQYVLPRNKEAVIIVARLSDWLGDGSYSITAERDISSVIEAGLQWLRDHQNPDGSWTYSGRITEENVGLTAMATTAFLNYGIDESDSTVQKAINWILSKQDGNGAITSGIYYVYDTSLAVLALVSTGNMDYYDEIRDAVNYLISVQNDEDTGYTSDNPYYGGWPYWGGMDWADLSNTQFVLLALHYAENMKKDDTIVPSEVWDKAEIFVTRCQNREASNPDYNFYDDGGFIYMPGSTIWADGRSYGSITSAGLWGLYTCGVSKTDGRVVDAWNWMEYHYYVDQNYPIGNELLYYYLYSLSKAAQLWGKTEIGGHDWYEEISNYLINHQEDDGHWAGTGSSEEPDLVATCWALLSLEVGAIQKPANLELRVDSPVDLHVYNQYGRHIGMNYETGLPEIEIPGATYTGRTEPQIITLPNAPAGIYRIVLIPFETGSYTLTIRCFSDGELISENSFSGDAERGEHYATDLSLSAIAGSITIDVRKPEAPPNEVNETATKVGKFSIVSDKGVVEDIHTFTKNQVSRPPSLTFPFGFFGFNVTGLVIGDTVNLTITLPFDIPKNAQYWKYGATYDNPTPHWYTIPILSNDGDNIIIIQLKDGGIGDDDCTPNGRVNDIGGVGYLTSRLKVTLQDSPDPVKAGDNLTYIITITDIGSAPAEGVYLKEYYDSNFIFKNASIPPSNENDTWTIDSIAPGETKEIRITGKVLNNGEKYIRNYLGYDSSNGGSGSVEEYTTLLYALPGIELKVPSKANAGDEITCKLIYYNGGNLNMDNVTIHFSFPHMKMVYENATNEKDWIDDLKANSGMERDIPMKVDSSMDNGTILPLYATLDWNNIHLNCSKNITINSSPLLNIKVNSSNNEINEGDNVTYSIKISNIGNMNAYNVTIVFDYDESLLDIIATNGSDDGNKITWHANIPAGKSIIYEIKAKAKDIEEEKIAFATINASCNMVWREENIRTKILPVFIPNLTIGIDYPNETEKNCIVVYKINISNIGNGVADATITFDYNESLLDIIATNGSDDGNKITWHANIPAGKSIIYEIKAKVKSNNGNIFNLAKVEWNGNKRETNSLTTIVNFSPFTQPIFHGNYNSKTKWGYTYYTIPSSTYITLEAKDFPNCSGVNHTYYRIWKYNGEWKLLFNWKEYDGQKIELGKYGTGHKYAVDYYSVDKAGNKERGGSIEIYVKGGMYGMKEMPGFELIALIAAIALLLRRKRF